MMPNCFAALRQKVLVEFEDQSAYKEREPVNRQRPSDLTAAEPPTEQDKPEKKKKKAKPGTAGKKPSKRPSDITTQLTPAAGAEDIVEAQSETVTEYEAPSLGDRPTHQDRSMDDHVTDTETESEIKSINIS